MLDLAITIDTDPSNTIIIETNRGEKLKAPEWPQDCDFQLVAFSPEGDTCEVVSTEGLAEDIGSALLELDRMGALGGGKPDWYRRLELYASEVSFPRN